MPKAIHAVFAPLFPCVNDDLGITMRPENVTQGGKLPGKIFEIINFPIEDDYDAAVFIEKRLLATGNIHDRKAAMTEADTRLGI